MIFGFGRYEEEAFGKFKLKSFCNKCNSLAVSFKDHAEDRGVTATSKNMTLRFSVMGAKWTNGERGVVEGIKDDRTLLGRVCIPILEINALEKAARWV